MPSFITTWVEHMSDNSEQEPSQIKTLTDWPKAPSVADLKQDYSDARSYHSNQVSKIDTWLDNLNVTGKAQIKTPVGNSSVVPKLIRKQAEWRYAALSEPFLSTTDVFNVSPITYEDRDAAIQNQLVLNNQFNMRINKISFIDEYVRTAVDEGTVIVRVGWDFQEKEVEVEVPDFQYVINPAMLATHHQLAQMQTADPEGFAAQVSPEMQQAHALSLEHGQPIEPVANGTKLVKQMKTVVNQPTLEICDYRNILIDPTCKGDMDKASFVIYSFESSKAALEKDGKYHNLEHINVEANSILGDPDHAAGDGSQSFNFADTPRKKIVVHEYWGFRDIDGSGRLQPIVAAWVGDILIRLELNPYPDQKLPFIVVHYLPVRKSTHGEPDGALLEDNQKIAGAVTRGMIDIMGKSANGQTGIRKDALDLTNKRKFEQGKDYEFNANIDPRQAIHMHVFPEIPVSAQFMLQLQNLEAESLTGVKSFSQGVSGASLGDVAVGVRGALDAASKRELGILRRLSAGIVLAGRKIISMNAEFLSETEVIRITNEKFVEVRRDDLAGNFDLTLSISTAEEDNNKAEELGFMLQTMGPNMDPEMSRMILSDIARLKKMPDLAQRILEYKPEPDPLVVKQQELEIAKLEVEIAALRARAQRDLANAQLDGVKENTELARAEELRSKVDQNNLDFVEQESGVKQERELQKHGEQARSQLGMKILDHKLKQDGPKAK